jgi:eukaryotic-like serine/threonine-protein kinase
LLPVLLGGSTPGERSHPLSKPRVDSEPSILFSHEDVAYEFIQSLGVGPHGETRMLARKRTPRSIEEEVILKCVGLPPGGPSAAAQRSRARLEEEVRLAAYLDHPAITRVHGLHAAEGALYTIVEHVRGPVLDDLLTLALERGRFFSEAFTLYVGARLAAALHHAHTRTDERGRPLGIVHRNISTASIRVTWAGEVKLADFGLARSQLAGRMATTRRRAWGPVFFTSPEALFGGEVDARSDLFAVGLVLLELATGRNLLDPGDTTTHELEQRLSERQRRRVQRVVAAAVEAGLEQGGEQAIWGAAAFTPEDMEKAAERLSAPLRAILRTVLRRVPAERIQTAEALEDALLARLAAVGPYGAREAVTEIEQTMTEAGEAMVAHELSDHPRSRFSSKERDQDAIATR